MYTAAGRFMSLMVLRRLRAGGKREMGEKEGKAMWDAGGCATMTATYHWRHLVNVAALRTRHHLLNGSISDRVRSRPSQSLTYPHNGYGANVCTGTFSTSACIPSRCAPVMHQTSFLPRDARSAKRGIAIVSLPSVCPSVRNVDVP